MAQAVTVAWLVTLCIEISRKVIADTTSQIQMILYGNQIMCLSWKIPFFALQPLCSHSFVIGKLFKSYSQTRIPTFIFRHNFMIFGGFLLKSTFELAFCCAASLSHSRPRFVSLDPSTFQNPVPVGSVLYLTATVTYTDPPVIPSATDGDENVTSGLPKPTNGRTRIQVRVDSKVRNVEHEETKPTGQFNYTFMVDNEVGVMPRTYTEFMMYIDARRRTKQVASLIAGMEHRAEQSVTE